MTKPLKVLVVEDDERDAAVLLRELRRGGYEPQVARVETPETMSTALDDSWDIVLSAYSMPRFSGPEALAMLRERGLDVPFIVVSGTVGEESAVTAMLAGANDFMLKDSLARLVPAIERELREANLRAERRKMQEQLMTSERMASIGMLAASVAHEINNPLQVIAGNLEFVAQDLDLLAKAASTGGDLATRVTATLDKLRQPLRDAQEASERVRNIARDLKVFSRSPDEETSGPVDIEPVLESAVRMASNEIRHRADLVREYTTVPPVEANEARLGQVFLNLIVNAAQAIPAGHASEHEIRLATRVDASGQVVVEVRDTGVGMPRDVQARIFDPFFTTKADGIGTGLGLAICHRIVTRLGGTIAVESQPGRGTSFRVTLPRAEQKLLEQAAAATAAAEQAPKSKGRILVIDDEPLLCSTIERILALDHDVTAVMSAQRAVQLIKGGERFDVILSDLMMPEMTGMDLYTALRRSAPDQADRMVFMTGGAFSQNAAVFLAQVPNQSIEKPFKSTTLRQLVQRLVS